MKIRFPFPLIYLIASALAGCSSIPTLDSRQQHADSLARQKHWISEDIKAGEFVLRSYHPAKTDAINSLTIFIEGDGLAWISRELPSHDPTPTAPLALKLALAHPDDHAVYLARPCQYTGTDQCDQKYWTHSRFAPEVVSSMSLALDQLKARFLAEDIHLVGYSGGGALAALLAARRNDVRRLVTVAGNLDHEVWTRLHRISPLTGSLNAADEAHRVRDIPQRHFVGGVDHNIPLAVAQSFVQRGGINPSAIMTIQNHDHRCCWAEQWAGIYSAAFQEPAQGSQRLK